LGVERGANKSTLLRNRGGDEDPRGIVAPGEKKTGILERMLKKQDGRVWTGFVWLWIGTSEHGNKPSGFINR
jgi:hypothetical protein